MSKHKFKSIPLPRPNGLKPMRRFRQPGRRYESVARQPWVNPRTLKRKRELSDERTIWWAVAFGILILVVMLTERRTLIEAIGIFGIYASINVIWALVMRTSGVFSMGTLATVGTSGFLAAKIALEFGLPWWVMLPLGAVFGGLMGSIIGIPAQRLDGMYYALLTLGVVELVRNYFEKSRTFGSSTRGLLNVPTFLPAEHMLDLTGGRIKSIVALGLLALTVVFYRLLDGRTLGNLLKTMRDSEAFGNAIGIDLARIRLTMFVLASLALGLIGGFYASYNRTISSSIFDLDLLLLMFAMIVLGGWNSSEGVAIGTGLVLAIDRGLQNLGPIRFVIVGVALIVVTLSTKNGIYGIAEQYRLWRDKRKSERIAAASQRDGDLTIDEAALTNDKDEMIHARFTSYYKPALRKLVNDRVVAEHAQDPVGMHSPDLERLLNYFRKGELAEKYVVYSAGAEGPYRVLALSGEHQVPPREVDENIFVTINEAYQAVFLRRVQDLVEE